VLPDPSKQPLSVRLPALSQTTELDIFLAALLISTSIPIVFFLIFQRFFLRGGGLDGAVKG
jgi:multiple sugar transport system permease protein